MITMGFRREKVWSRHFEKNNAKRKELRRAELNKILKKKINNTKCWKNCFVFLFHF